MIGVIFNYKKEAMVTLGLNKNTDCDADSTKEIQIQIGALRYITGVNIAAHHLLFQESTVSDYLLKVKSATAISAADTDTDV